MATNVNQRTEDLWTFETPVYISEKLKQAIKTHHGFSAPPIGPIGELIISDQIRYRIPESLATSYILNSHKDVAVFRQLIDSYNEPQPIVITYPYPKSMYNNACTNVNKEALKEALKLENPATANVLIDHLGLLCSEGKK